MRRGYIGSRSRKHRQKGGFLLVGAILGSKNIHRQKILLRRRLTPR